VTQHVLLSILSLSHSYFDYMHSIQSGEWQEGSGFSLLEHPIKELSGKKLGIVGFGVLGKGVAKAASILGMETLICESFNPDKPDGSLHRVGFDELLRESDVVSLHCPLTEETDDIFNDDAFEKMKSSAILINTARGGLVNDQALIKAIENRSIAGAAIDVLDQEPPDSDHPLMKKNYKNLIITPHIAWAARESRQRALDRIADNVEAFQRGKPINVVKPRAL
jgi:Lactate dehydrogenase and related dehydrogenases